MTMSAPLSTDEALIEKLLGRLKAEGYSLRIQRWYPARVRQLLDDCNRNALTIETVRSAHVTQFLRRQYLRSRKQGLPIMKRLRGPLNSDTRNAGHFLRITGCFQAE